MRIVEIVATTGRSQSAVRAVRGMHGPRTRRTIGVVHAKRDRRMAELRLRGYSVARVARLFGLSTSTVWSTTQRVRHRRRRGVGKG